MQVAPNYLVSPAIQVDQVQLRPECQHYAAQDRLDERNESTCHLPVPLDDKLIANNISSLVLELDKSRSFAESRSSQRLLKTIFSIYFMMIRLSPLECHFSIPTIKSNETKSQPLQYSRQQVLSYIESLDGYPGSINTLRLILKSETMIAVMGAYEQIVDQLKRKNL